MASINQIKKKLQQSGYKYTPTKEKTVDEIIRDVHAGKYDFSGIVADAQREANANLKTVEEWQRRAAANEYIAPEDFQRYKDAAVKYGVARNTYNAYNGVKEQPSKPLSSYIENHADALSSFPDQESYTNAKYASKYDGYTYDAIQKVIASRQRRGKDQQETDWLKRNRYNYATKDELEKLLSDDEERVKKAAQDDYARIETDLEWSPDVYGNETKDVPQKKYKFLSETERNAITRAIDKKKKEQEESDRVKRYDDYMGLQSMDDFQEKSSYVNDDNRVYYNEYDYINGIKPRMDQMSGYDETILNFQGYKALDEMTDEEKSVYNYIYNTQGEEKASEFLEDLKLSRRQAAGQSERIANYAKEDPFGASIGSVLVGPFKAFGIVEDITNYISGKPVDPDSFAHSASRVQKVARDTISGDMSGLGSFLYQTGMSMGDFLLSTAATGGFEPLNLAVMGTGAAADAVIEAKERGISDGKALATGILAGIAEALFERVSLEQLKVFQQTGAPGIKAIIKDILKGFFTEGSEELFTDLANAFTDAVINGQYSEYNTNIKRYIEEGGLSEEEAKKKALADFGLQLFESFAGGALSGGVMSGVALSVGNANYRAEQNAAYREEGRNIIDTGDVGGIVSDAQESGNKKLARLAERVAKQNAANRSSMQQARYERNVGRLYEGAAASAVRGANETYSDVVNAKIDEAVNGADLAKSEQKAAKHAVQLAHDNGYETLSEKQKTLVDKVGGEELVDTLTSAETQNAVTEEETSRVSKALRTIGRANKKVGGQEYSTNGKAIILENNEDATVSKDAPVAGFAKDGTVMIATEDGASYKATDLALAGENDAVLVNGLKMMHKNFNISEGTANAIYKALVDNNLASSEYMPGVYRAYQLGLQASSLGVVDDAAIAKRISNYAPSSKGLRNISTDLAVAVYKLGMDEAKAETQSKRERISKKVAASKKSAAKMPSEMVSKEVRKIMSDKNDSRSAALRSAVDSANVLSLAHGIEFRFVDGGLTTAEGEVANATYDNGVITVDINANMDGRAILAYTMSHELTHFIAQWSPEKYRTLADFLMQSYREEGHGDEMDLAIAKRMESGMSYEVASEEFVAECCQRFLLDTNAMENATKLAAKDGNLVKRMVSFLKDYAAKIRVEMKEARDLYKDTPANSLQSARGVYIHESAITETLKNIDKIRAMWEDALADAGRNYRASEQGAVDEGGAMYQTAAGSEELRAAKDELAARGIVLDEAQSWVTDLLKKAEKNAIAKNTVFRAKAYHGIALIYDYIVKGNSNLEQEVKETFGELADDVVGYGLVSRTRNDRIAAAKDWIRQQTFAKPDGIEAEFGGKEDFANWRRKHSSLKMNKAGDTSIDTAYAELCTMFPEFFTDDITHPSEQLKRMAEILDMPVIEEEYISEDERKSGVEYTVANLMNESLRIATTDEEAITERDRKVAAEKIRELADSIEKGDYITGSPREILSTALMATATTQEERQKLATYQKNIAALDDMQTRLTETRARIKELSFGKGPRDTNTLNNLKASAQKLEGDIVRQDKRLLTLEATAPLKRVVENARKQGAAKVKQELDTLRETQRERMEKREKQIRQEYREKRKAAVEKRKATVVRNKIKALQKEFVKELMGKAGKKYVEGQLVEGLVQVYHLIDPTGFDQDTKVAQRYKSIGDALTNLAAQYKALEKSGDVDLASEINDEFYAKVAELANMVKDKPLREMNYETLSNVYDVLNDIQYMLQTARKQIGVKEAITNYQAGQRAIDNLLEVKKLKLTTNEITSKIRNWTVNPLRAVYEMSGFADDAVLVDKFRDLETGRQKKDWWAMNAKKPFDKLRRTKEDRSKFEAIVTKPFDFGLTARDGKPLKMTKMQAMTILMTYYREMANEGRVHATENGGIVPDIDYEIKGKHDEAKRMGQHTGPITLEFIDAIESKLDEYDSRYLQAAQDLFWNKSGDAINSVTMITKHRPIATEQRYFPYTVDSDYVRSEDDNIAYDASIENRGKLKDIVKGARQQLIFDSLNRIIEREIKDTSEIYGYTIPVRNWNKIINMVQTNEDGGLSLKSVLTNVWGAEGTNLLRQSVADVQSSRRSDIPKFFSSIKSGFVVSTLASNLSVWMKQGASYFTAGSVLSSRALSRGLSRYMTKITKGIHAEDVWAEIDKITAEHYIRREGLSLQETGDMAQGKGWVNRLNQKLGKASPMNWIQSMDVATTAILFYACEEEINLKNKRSGNARFGSTDDMLKKLYNRYTTQELDDIIKDYGAESVSELTVDQMRDILKKTELHDLYEKVITETQPMYDSLHRAEVTKNPHTRAIVMFKTQPLQNSGIVREGYMKLRAMNKKYGANSEQAKAARRNFGKATYSIAKSHLVFVAMTFLSGALIYKLGKWKDENEELTPESMMEHFFVEFGKQYFDTILPVAGGIVTSAIEKIYGKNNYDVISHPTVDMVNNYVTALTNAISKPTVSNFVNVGLKTAAFFGIPAENARNILVGAWNHIQDISKGEFLSFEQGVDRKASAEARRAYKAYVSGDLDKMRKVVDEYVEKKDASSLKSMFTKQLKGIYVNAEASGDKETQDQIRNFLLETGLYTDSKGKKTPEEVVDTTLDRWLK